MGNSARDVAIRFTNVARHFGDVRAVDAVSMDIYDGEFFSMLGPSGSGKTTCLRLIAGFEQPSAGSIQLYGEEVAGIPPYDRDVNTVFQDYALFPHMTIEDNIGYGPMIKGVPNNLRKKQVDDMLELVRLPGLGKRKPGQLSGGQRQRVALARALINEPRVLLLDEPLGALDLKLRQEMQIELKAIQQRVGITFIYVTHDQEEALTMSDRIAVFNQGKIEQIGTPTEMYERPETMFVASFVGTSNIFAGELAQNINGDARAFAIRPEKIRIMENVPENGADVCCVRGFVRDVTYLGMYTRYLLELLGGGDLIVVQQNQEQDAQRQVIKQGQDVTAMWSKSSNCYLRET
jgi:putative spermidine/putrescine transport system ATP-binding protein